MVRRLSGRKIVGVGALVAGLSVLLSGCEATKPTPPAKAPEIKSAPALSPEYRPAESPILKRVRAHGYISCGVHPGLPGFALPDARGRWRGFDVDLCRAVAAAVFGDADKVRFVVVPGEDRFGALRRGEVDILSRNTSQTFARDAGLGLSFPVITYFDGQGFLVPKALGLASAEELGGARVCVQANTASADNAADYFRARGMRYRPVFTASEEQARRLYETEGCDVFTADVSALAASRSLLGNPGAHVILPDVISKEPLGPVVRQDDPAWADVVRWTVFATLLAEERGVTSKNVEDLRQTSPDPEVRRLLGVDGDMGGLLGLQSDWAFQVIRQVGAYGEIFHRDLGEESALELDRGLNALWNARVPGLMYAPPMR